MYIYCKHIFPWSKELNDVFDCSQWGFYQHKHIFRAAFNVKGTPQNICPIHCLKDSSKLYPPPSKQKTYHESRRNVTCCHPKWWFKFQSSQTSNNLSTAWGLTWLASFLKKHSTFKTKNLSSVQNPCDMSFGCLVNRDPGSLYSLVKVPSINLKTNVLNTAHLQSNHSFSQAWQFWLWQKKDAKSQFLLHGLSWLVPPSFSTPLPVIGPGWFLCWCLSLGNWMIYADMTDPEWCHEKYYKTREENWCIYSIHV